MPLALLLIAPTVEARYDVLLKGKKSGVATYRLSDRPGGGRVTRLRVVLADGSTSESLSVSDVFGAALRSEDVVRRGKSFTKRTVEYDAKGDATVVANGGKPVAVPFRGRGNRKDPSETWFRSVTPKPGTWATYLKLDAARRTWEPVRVTYVGPQDGGHLVRQVAGKTRTDFTLDARGVPIAILSGDLRMVRR